MRESQQLPQRQCLLLALGQKSAGGTQLLSDGTGQAGVSVGVRCRLSVGGVAAQRPAFREGPGELPDAPLSLTGLVCRLLRRVGISQQPRAQPSELVHRP
jgi:hypothetical protein